MQAPRTRPSPTWLVLAVVAAAAACDEGFVAPTATHIVTPEFVLIGTDDVNQIFTVTNTDDSGPGSLRQAILDANAAPGTDGIAFSIDGSGPHTIQPASALPVITDAVVIDGYTQPGSAPNTNAAAIGSNADLQIELDGSVIPEPVSGLELLADASAVRGLVINGFDEAIVVASAGNRIQGNFVGTDVSGATPVPNSGNGILVLDSDNVIGGDTPADRNVVSGNLGDGVRIDGPSAMRNRVAGNYIGLDATGTGAIPNGLPEPDPTNSAAVHISFGASENVVGGAGSMPSTCDGPCNVISGNHRTGVWIDEDGHHNTVQGNLIGTDASGLASLGNFRFGVFLGSPTTSASDNAVVGNRIQFNGRDGIGLLAGASRNAIGGVAVTPGSCEGDCNYIAFNGQRLDTGGDGVRVFASGGVDNAILGNVIFGHERGQAIDIGNAGLTFNDFGDFDVGSNNLQNYPELVSASVDSRRLVVEGWIDTPAPETVLIELYGNPVPEPGPDPSGFGEGAVFLGRAAPDAGGSFSAILGPVDAGTLISATATDARGNTSEFAFNIAAVPGRGPDPGQVEAFFPFSFSFFTCSEVVSLSGAFRDVFQVTITPTGQLSFVGHLEAIGLGVGQTTGALYNWNDVITQQVTAPITSPQVTFTTLESLQLIGRGDADNFRLQAMFHVTVSADGVERVTVDNFMVDCG